MRKGGHRASRREVSAQAGDANPSTRSELYVMKRRGQLNARSSPPHRNKHLTARSSPQHFTPSYQVDRMSDDATTDTATKIQMQRNTNRNQSSTSRQHQPSTETSTAGEREPAQPSRSVASHCSRKACRSEVKVRRMLLCIGQKQWILGCTAVSVDTKVAQRHIGTRLAVSKRPRPRSKVQLQWLTRTWWLEPINTPTSTRQRR